MSTTYLVEIDMRMKGDLAAALAPAGAKLDELAGKVTKLGEALKALGGPVDVGLQLKADLVPEVNKLASGLEEAQKNALELKSTLGSLEANGKVPGGGTDGSDGAVRPLAPKIKDAKEETSKLGDAVRAFGKTAVGAFTGAVEKVGALTLGLAAAGATAGIGAVTYGVLSLNKQLENTKVSLATIFAANGVASDVSHGLGMAAETVAKMRKDAAALPGEFHELLGIFQTIASSGFNSGASRSQLEDLAAQAMAASKVVGLPSDMAGRELAQLLEGRAGSHNVLGMRLGIGSGDQAQAFNKLGAEERLARIREELAKFEPAFSVFESSFDGAGSSFMNNARELLRVVTEPVFGKLTGALVKVNKWIEDNESRIAGWTTLLGQKLSDAWDWGTKKIEEWRPAVEAFATHAFVKLKSVWEEVQPYAERFGEIMKEALQDPGTIDKLITLLKLYAAVKVGGGLVDAVGGWGNAASIGKGIGGGVAKFGKKAVLDGGLKAIEWGSRFGAGALGVGAATGGASAGAAGAGGAAAASGTGVLVAGGALAAGAATLALAGLGAAAWQTKGLLADLDKAELDDARARYESAMRVVEEAGKSAEAYEHVTTMMRKLELTGNETAAAAIELHLGLANAAASAEILAANFADIRDGANVPQDPMVGRMSMLSEMPHWSAESKKDDKRKPPRHPGGAGMNVQKVEIVVTSNQDPSRIARLVSSELANLRRHPRVSPHVPNYSASM